ncbi:MAG: bifunctional DNA primase/polymerase [Phycisphaerales bacterium]|nr:bifunctional DNA primase/polymerase [Phycisphaerales bacterium]
MSNAETPPPSSRLAAAEAYMLRGYMPIPLELGSKAILTPGWTKLRYTVERLPEHFGEAGNIGLLLGDPSGGLVDVDLDCPEAIELADQFLPPTGAISGRQSYPSSHRWYISAQAVTLQVHDPVSKDMIVELRSTGCQTVVGPSIHPLGERYSPLTGEPAVVEAEHLRACVQALAEAVVIARHGALPVKPEPRLPRARVHRSDEPSEQVQRRAQAYLAKIPGAVSNQGGHPLTYAAATAMVHGFGLHPQVALDLLRAEYNPRCQPPWSEKELRHKVDDAATKPHHMPRGWLRDAVRSSPGPASDKEPRLDAPLSDLGNAERLATKCRDQMRYCHTRGKWLVWDGTRWQDDQTGTPIRLAGELAREMLRDACDVAEFNARSGLASWGLKSEMRPKLEAAVVLAQSQPTFVVLESDLDADPWQLNTLAGTIDLRTGAVREHDRHDLITKLAPVQHDPCALCPRFDAFMSQLFPNAPEVVAYLRRFLGMCLTGDINEQVMPILLGEGANGKSVLLDTVRGIMGDYAGDAPPHLLVERKGCEHPTEIADLFGKRLVVASETGEADTLKLQLIKRLTGDATLKGRFMRQNYVERARTHKLILVTNNWPNISEDTEAVWRRLHIVKFEVVIPEAERDTRLIEKLAAERPGVLAWLVRGCLEWQRTGLCPPAAVVRETKSRRVRSASPGRFLDECCEMETGADHEEGFEVPFSDLMSAYGWWMTDRPGSVSSRELQLELACRGLESRTKRVGRVSAKVRVGVRLRPEVLASLRVTADTAVTAVQDEPQYIS